MISKVLNFWFVISASEKFQISNRCDFVPQIWGYEELKKSVAVVPVFLCLFGVVLWYSTFCDFDMKRARGAKKNYFTAADWLMPC